MYSRGASRVVSFIKIDYKPEGVTMDEKFINTGKTQFPISFAVLIIAWESLVYVLKPRLPYSCSKCSASGFNRIFSCTYEAYCSNFIVVILGFITALILSCSNVTFDGAD